MKDGDIHIWKIAQYLLFSPQCVFSPLIMMVNETHWNSSSVEWNMWLLCCGHEKCLFLGMRRMLNVMLEQVEVASTIHRLVWQHDHLCKWSICLWRIIYWDCGRNSLHGICTYNVVWRPENAESFLQMSSANVNTAHVTICQAIWMHDDCINSAFIVSVVKMDETWIMFSTPKPNYSWLNGSTQFTTTEEI